MPPRGELSSNPHLRSAWSNEQLLVAIGDDVLELSGAAARQVEAALALAARPTARRKLIALFERAGADGRALLRELERRGLFVAAPRRPAAVHLVTAGPTAGFVKLLREALAPVPLKVSARLPAAATALAFFSDPADPRYTRLSALARRRGCGLLPVRHHGGYGTVGPAQTKDGPCALCALLRLLAREARGLTLLAEQLHHTAAAPRGPRLEGAAGRALAAAAALAVAQPPAGLLKLDYATGACVPHPVLRNVSCPGCGRQQTGRARALDGDARRVREQWQQVLEGPPLPAMPIDEARAWLADPVTGPLDLHEAWAGRRYFRGLPIIYGGIKAINGFAHRSTFMGINGTGGTLELQRTVSLSEGCERYLQYNHVPAYRAAPLSKVSAHALDPARLTGYGAAQYATPGFPHRPSELERPLSWSWAVRLSDLEPRLLPSELVGLDVSYEGQLFTETLSSGGASHPDVHSALCNAYRELIERDQFMIAWYKRVALRRLELPERLADPYAQELRDFLKAHGVRVHHLDLRLDLPFPAVLTVSEVDQTQGNLEPGALVFLATCDLDPMKAVARGLMETLLHYETMALHPEAAKDYRSHPYDPEDVAQGWSSWWPLYLHYLDPQHARAARWVLEGSGTTDFLSLKSHASGDSKTDAATFLRALRARGLEPHAAYLTTPEVAFTGFHVLKVVVPGMVPLAAGKQSRRLACPRFETAAAASGQPHLPPGAELALCHPNA
ncbi:MAG: TOMM precursor leader peptide-binding protein [Archangiaceae bacterium]|nr:TOMM precursor leader peptide-binding protein [Archangiaceae bacterium]